MLEMYNVLITGASRGIGRAVKELFEQNAYNVIAPSRQEMDLSNIESVKEYIKHNKDLNIDIIINNAGINDINFIENVTDKELERMFNVNLVAPILLTRAFVPYMKKMHFGRIVNIGSIWGIVSKEGRCIYSATKNGINGVTNTLAIELAPNNILVNTVCPGFTLTELTYKNNTKEQIDLISSDIPIGRMAKPEEIAKTIFFLGNEKNTYITGQRIAVDGGFSVK